MDIRALVCILSWFALGLTIGMAEDCMLSVEFDGENYRLKADASRSEVRRFVKEMFGGAQFNGAGCDNTDCAALQIEGQLSTRRRQCIAEAAKTLESARRAALLKAPWYERYRGPSDSEILACHSANLDDLHDMSEVDTVLSSLEKAVVGLGKVGHSGDFREEQLLYARLASLPCVRRICEIGFNAGHSAAIWLSVNDHAEVLYFDLFDEAAGPAGERFLRETEQLVDPDKRLRIVKGSSTDTLPAFASANPNVKCDLLVVDGGHAREVAYADIANFRPLARSQFHILVVDDTYCDAYWCIGPTKAIEAALADRLIEPPLKVLTMRKPDSNQHNRSIVLRGVALLRYRP